MEGISSIVLAFINLLNIICSNIGTVEGIQGGTPAEANHNFKYQVSILINSYHACGGSILDFKRIISAAQCVLDRQGNFLDVRFEILAGINRLASQSYLNVRRRVLYIYIVYDFRPPTRVNHLYPDNVEVGDLSILEIEGTLPLRENNLLKIIYIPLRVHGIFKKFTGKNANMSGFGQDQPMEYQSASDLDNLLSRQNSQGILKYTTTLVDRSNNCLRVHENYRDSVHLCARSTKVVSGACHGDIGGPLVMEGDFIIGVLQIYPDDCDDNQQSSIYTRITYFVDFIENVMRSDFKSDMRLANYTGQHVVEKRHPGHPA